MSVVVISPTNVVDYPDGGGHFWVYLQYALGLRSLGIEVYWLEEFTSTGSWTADRRKARGFLQRMRRFGFEGNTILYTTKVGCDAPQFCNWNVSAVYAIIRSADLLLNFHYRMAPSLVDQFRRSALVDIDPGLLQFWMTNNQLQVAPHHYYFTVGEHVGPTLANSRKLDWIPTRRVVSLDQWKVSIAPRKAVFTTVSGWWAQEWVSNGAEISFDNTKRASFLRFIDLPSRARRKLELALCLGPGDEKEAIWLRKLGWRIRSAQTLSSPRKYQRYIQRSYGEFSIAKPSTVFWPHAWVSDRTLCYLANGKPVVIQDTGPSSYLPIGEGVFRFTTADDALQAIDVIQHDYQHHCRRAREIAEAYFDSRVNLRKLLDAVG